MELVRTATGVCSKQSREEQATHRLKLFYDQLLQLCNRGALWQRNLSQGRNKSVDCMLERNVAWRDVRKVQVLYAFVNLGLARLWPSSEGRIQAAHNNVHLPVSHVAIQVTEAPPQAKQHVYLGWVELPLLISLHAHRPRQRGGGEVASDPAIWGSFHVRRSQETRIRATGCALVRWE